MQRAATTSLSIAVLLAACGCDRSSGSGDQPTAAPATEANASTPRAAFDRSEAILASDAPLSATCTLSASGAVTANLQALLSLGPGNRVNLTVTGDFGGEPVDAELATDGTETFITKDGETNSANTPTEIREAVAIGMTRMGLLHNAAMLVEGQLPDHADGGVREWVETENHRITTPEGDETEVLTFDLVVAGGVPATATLEFDAEARPTHRTQEVSFAEGTMTVAEDCQWQEVRD